MRFLRRLGRIFQLWLIGRVHLAAPEGDRALRRHAPWRATPPAGLPVRPCGDWLEGLIQG